MLFDIFKFFLRLGAVKPGKAVESNKRSTFILAIGYSHRSYFQGGIPDEESAEVKSW